jgi:hypothetical protein
VVASHSSGRESFFENFATPFPAQLRHPPGGFHRILKFIHDKARVAFFHYFGDCATAIRNHWRAARDGFNHD